MISNLGGFPVRRRVAEQWEGVPAFGPPPIGIWPESKEVSPTLGLLGDLGSVTIRVGLQDL